MAFFEPALAALNDAGIRYVVVGGVAVVLHGHPRLTADLDLALDLAPARAAEAVEALLSLGLRPSAPVDAAQFADPDIRRRWAEDKAMTVLAFSDPDDPLREIDVFVENPIDFEELWDRSVLLPLQTTAVRVASIDDLIAMKRQAGRPQDLADIEALEAILDARNG